MNGQRWRVLLLLVVAVSLLLFASGSRSAAMAEYTVHTGSVYQMNVSGCAKKESAIAILDAKKISHEHALKLYSALNDCDSIPINFRVGAVIHTIKTEDGEIYRVVEIHHPMDSSQKAYWMTSMQIAPAKKGKPSDEIQQPKKSQQRDA